jgi:hypothetical protein
MADIGGLNVLPPLATFPTKWRKTHPRILRAMNFIRETGAVPVEGGTIACRTIIDHLPNADIHPSRN